MLTEKEYKKYRHILKSDLTNLKLDVSFPFKEMYEEILPFLDNFVVHRAKYGNGMWKSLVLHGAGTFDTTSTKTKEFWEAGGKITWTKMANVCEVAYNFFDKVWPQNRHKRIRWMLLEPGGEIGLHKDSNDCMLGDAVNFSLNQPEGCDFYIGGELIPWKAGEARLLNLSNYHKIKNNSNERRIHMIYHGHDIRCGRLSEWSKKNRPFHIDETDENFIKLVIRSYEKLGYGYDTKPIKVYDKHIKPGDEKVMNEDQIAVTSIDSSNFQIVQADNPTLE